MWYKAEAAVGSEFAGKYLYDNGLDPIYVSDNPILNAQHVVFEAAKAYKYGLPYHAALASVTSAPAENLGLGKRLGKVKAGFDADVVVWDSDPLSVGATPVQVWIDGTAQFADPVELDKPFHSTMSPNEALAEVPGDRNKRVVRADDVIFTGVSRILLIDVDIPGPDDATFNVAVSGGTITCIGRCAEELELASRTKDGSVIPLRNGYLTRPYVAFGSMLGLNAIESERVTDNGADFNSFSRAIDGLALDTEKLRVGHRSGVTRAISAPRFIRENSHHGTSVGFQTGAISPLDDGAIFAEDAAVHYTLDLSVKKADGTPSLSSSLGQLRDKLLDAIALSSLDGSAAYENPDSEMAFLKRVVSGELPLAITVHSADVIATLLRIKGEVEETANNQSGIPRKIRIIIIGGAEAHLLADRIAEAEVGVVLAPFQSFGVSWDQRRALVGAPLSNSTSVDVLTKAGVTTAIGLEEDWVVRDLGLLAGIAHKNIGGRISEEAAVDLITGNVYKMLGLSQPDWRQHFVIHEGNPLEIDSRVKAVSDGMHQLYIL